MSRQTATIPGAHRLYPRLDSGFRTYRAAGVPLVEMVCDESRAALTERESDWTRVTTMRRDAVPDRSHILAIYTVDELERCVKDPVAWLHPWFDRGVKVVRLHGDQHYRHGVVPRDGAHEWAHPIWFNALASICRRHGVTVMAYMHCHSWRTHGQPAALRWMDRFSANNGIGGWFLDNAAISADGDVVADLVATCRSEGWLVCHHCTIDPMYGRSGCITPLDEHYRFIGEGSELFDECVERDYARGFGDATPMRKVSWSWRERDPDGVRYMLRKYVHEWNGRMMLNLGDADLRLFDEVYG